MSSTGWIKFPSTPEAKRIRQVLKPLTVGDLFKASFGRDNEVQLQFSWYGAILRIDRSSWFPPVLAEQIVTREICKRFPVIRIGASEMSWYNEPAPDGQTWAEWYAKWDPKTDPAFAHSMDVRMEALVADIVRQFEALDKKDGSSAGGSE